MQLLAHGQQPMDAGHPHVGDGGSAGAEDPRGGGCLSGHRQVGGSGAHHQHAALGRRQGSQDGCAAHRVESAPGQLAVQRLGAGVVDAGGQYRAVGMGFVQGVHDVHSLLGCLALREDHFRVPGAVGAMGVDLGEPEIDQRIVHAATLPRSETPVPAEVGEQ